MSTPTRRDWLSVAARLVATHGPHGFTMDDLARQAKVSRATLYRHASNREAVLEALRKRGVAIAPSAETRTRVLEAARTVFGRVGFEAATLEQIATHAEVAPASVYRHFGDKDGLVAAFLDEMTPRRLVRDLDAALTGDLRKDLEWLATRMLTRARDDAPLLRLVLLETLRGSEYLARMRALSPVRTLSALTRILEPHHEAGRLVDRDVHVLAHAFAGMMLGVAIAGPLLHGTRRLDPAEGARIVTDLFLRGALARRKRR